VIPPSVPSKGEGENEYSEDYDTSPLPPPRRGEIIVFIKSIKIMVQNFHHGHLLILLIINH